MNKKWIVENSESLLDTRWVKVRKDTVNLPNGTHIDDFYAITINDASAIVALDEDQNIILKKEYRYCYEKELLEIPAGTFEENETEKNVQRHEAVFCRRAHALFGDNGYVLGRGSRIESGRAANAHRAESRKSIKRNRKKYAETPD